MRTEDILVNDEGANIFGQVVGLVPSDQTFEGALDCENARHIAAMNGRQLRVCDAKGLSWLIDLNLRLVLWFDVSLAAVRHRPKSDHDPTDVFRGKLRVGQYSIRGSLSCETGEIVRTVVISGIGIRLVPEGKNVRAVNISFTQNEERSDVASHQNR